MDSHERHHHMSAIAGIVAAFAVVVFCVTFAVLVIWIVTAEPKTKLYEADGYVCASQPFATQCWKRE